MKKQPNLNITPEFAANALEAECTHLEEVIGQAKSLSAVSLLDVEADELGLDGEAAAALEAIQTLLVRERAGESLGSGELEQAVAASDVVIEAVRSSKGFGMARGALVDSVTRTSIVGDGFVRDMLKESDTPILRRAANWMTLMAGSAAAMVMGGVTVPMPGRTETQAKPMVSKSNQCKRLGGETESLVGEDGRIGGKRAAHAYDDPNSIAYNYTSYKLGLDD